MKKSRYSDSQILSILKQAENGVPCIELCREHGMSNATFYKMACKVRRYGYLLMARMNVIDNFNREGLAIEVNFSLPAERVSANGPVIRNKTPTWSGTIERCDMIGLASIYSKA